MKLFLFYLKVSYFFLISWSSWQSKTVGCNQSLEETLIHALDEMHIYNHARHPNVKLKMFPIFSIDSLCIFQKNFKLNNANFYFDSGNSCRD